MSHLDEGESRPNHGSIQRLILVTTAISALALSIYRANSQSITFDESFSYQAFARTFADVMTFQTNNHVLNSLLMWISTKTLGASELSVRMPALLGAGLYISISYLLSKRIAEAFLLRWALLACLIFNPFILDFMAAARGYSLANAFLLLALAVPILFREQGKRSLCTSCMVASSALGLSFTANFSFAFVDAAAWIVIFIWAVRMRGAEPLHRIIAASVLPGLALVLILAGYPLAHWPFGQWKEDLWWGAHSLKEMKASLIESTLFEINILQMGPLYRVATFLRRLTLLSLLIVCLARLALMLAARELSANSRARWTAGVFAMLASPALASISVSWLFFHFHNLPLPLGRTGIYLVTLCTLLAGVIAAAPARNLISRWLGHGITLVLVCLACYFGMCLRVSYFREYQWNADIKGAYAFVDRLNRSYGVTDIQVSGIYLSALKFYRDLSPDTRLPEFRYDTNEGSPGHALYIMDAFYWRDAIRKQNLAVLYHGEHSSLVVAVARDGQIPVP